MRRIQPPTFYSENPAEIVDTSVFGRMVLWINDAKLINRHNMTNFHVTYLKDQHGPTVLRQGR